MMLRTAADGPAFVMAVKQTGGNAIGKGKPGPGRPKGIPNKLTGQLKEAIIEALENAGGADYLTKLAKDKPQIFVPLLGKVLPLQVTGGDGKPLSVSINIK